MLSLFRVPEPKNREDVNPIPHQVREDIWRITLNNFSANVVDQNTKFENMGEFTTVLLAPEHGRHTKGEVSLEDFIHPKDTLLVVGPDSDHLDLESGLGWSFEIDHKVYIPNMTQHTMWGFTAYATFWWDRHISRESWI